MARSVCAALGIVLAGALVACSGGNKTAEPAVSPTLGKANVDGARIENADSEPGSWMSHGRTYSEQRYSPLAKINKDNVGQLGLAWFADLDTNRGQEATPLVVDGVIYVSTAWSKVKAFDAKTGKPLWAYDPQVPGQTAVNACCDVVNRGVAVWKGKVFVGTLDGRLIALDAATGNKLWDVVTVDQTKPYTITGAPRVVKGKVLIGNGGAELGVRGYVIGLRRRHGQAWPGASTPCPAIRRMAPDSAASDAAFAKMAGATWFGEYWKMRRRRHGVGFHVLRPRPRPALHRRRQRQPLEPQAAQRGQGRQPVPVLHRRAEARHRRIRVALPEHARRELGPHRHAADHHRGPHDRRRRSATW